jgi:cellulose synthase/poly-beta-1,6-N-acetylglucosamine synthase-like glycosyltransferase
VHLGDLVGLADRAVIAAGIVLELVFAVFFLRHFSFAISALRSAPSDLALPRVTAVGFVPSVSVLVACRDEAAVIDRLVASLVELRYPRDRLEFVLVDDRSRDQTGAMLEEFAARDDRVVCVHRPADALPGKSAALNAALDVATGEVLVVFDADHRPRPDVIRRLVTHFRDPRVAAVQGRCEISNGGDSLLARLIAIDYLGGYLVNEYGRQALFELPAYGGANCAVRAASVRALGGWNENSVTEDTDLTMRLALAGERIRYDVHAVDQEEGVVTLRRFWRQRYRWARGHQQVWRDYHGLVWSSPRLSTAEKVETTLFLLVFHLPIASALGLVIAVLWTAGLTRPADPLPVVLLWTLLFLGPLLELGAGLIVSGADRREARALVFFLPLFMLSTALCTKAWLDGLAGRPCEWVRTPRSAEPTTVVSR